MGKFNIFYYLMQMSQYPLCWLLCMKGPSCFTIISVGTLGQRSLKYSSSATGLCSSWKALWKNHCPQNIHNDWCTCWSPAAVDREGRKCLPVLHQAARKQICPTPGQGLQGCLVWCCFTSPSI